MKKLKNILISLSKEELIKLILKKSKIDGDFESSIISEFQEDITKSEYKQIISRSFDSVMDDYGWIKWGNVSRACAGMHKVLKNAENAIKDKIYQKAIFAAQSVIEIGVESYGTIDDSSGTLGGYIEDAFEILEQCANKKKLDSATRKEFFNYLIKEWEGLQYEDWSDWKNKLFKIALNIFSGAKESKIILLSMESNFIKGEEKRKESSYYTSHLDLKYETLLKLNMKKEADSFLYQNLFYSSFREKAIEIAYRNEEFDYVIELADAGLEKDKKYDGLLKIWYKWKLLVFKKYGDEQQIRTISLNMFIDFEDKYFFTYKNTFDSEDWANGYILLIRELKLRNTRTAQCKLAFVYSEEYEFDLLMSLIQDNHHLLQEYEKLLISNFKEEIIDIHILEIKKNADFARDRRAYFRLCQYNIKNLSKIATKSKVLEVIEMIANKYPRKKALLEELNKFKNKL